MDDQLKTAFLPKSRSDKFSLFCFSTFFICVFAIILIEYPDFKAPTTNTSNILFLILIASLCFGSSAMVIFSIRRARMSGLSVKSLKTPIIGLFFILTLSLVSLSINRDFEEMYAFFEKSNSVIKEIPDLEVLGPEEYSKHSFQVAQSRFMMTGESTEYSTSDGKRVLFKPTAEDREYFKRMETLNKYVLSGSLFFKKIIYFWLFLGFLSLLLGILTPIHNKSTKGSNSAV